MADKPEPRVDKDGVPWCRRDCPIFPTNKEPDCPCPDVFAGDVCPLAVRDMARELREARAQIDRDNANAYAESVLATLEDDGGKNA